MIRRPPRSTLSSSSAASDVYKRQLYGDAGLQQCVDELGGGGEIGLAGGDDVAARIAQFGIVQDGVVQVLGDSARRASEGASASRDVAARGHWGRSAASPTAAASTAGAGGK